MKVSMSMSKDMRILQKHQAAERNQTCFININWIAIHQLIIHIAFWNLWFLHMFIAQSKYYLRETKGIYLSDILLVQKK